MFILRPFNDYDDDDDIDNAAGENKL